MVTWKLRWTRWRCSKFNMEFFSLDSFICFFIPALSLIWCPDCAAQTRRKNPPNLRHNVRSQHVCFCWQHQVFCVMCLLKCTFFVCQVIKKMKSALKWLMNSTKLWWFILCISPVYCILQTFFTLKLDVSSCILSKLPIMRSFLERKPQRVH